MDCQSKMVFGSPRFSGVSPSFSGVFSNFTNFSGRAPRFLGVVPELLLLPVFTIFFLKLFFFSKALRFFPVFLLDPIRFFSDPPWIIRKLSRFSLRCSMLSWPFCPHSGMIKLLKFNHLSRGTKRQCQSRKGDLSVM